MSDLEFKYAVLGWTTPTGELSDELLWAYVLNHKTRAEIEAVIRARRADLVAVAP